MHELTASLVELSVAEAAKPAAEEDARAVGRAALNLACNAMFDCLTRQWLCSHDESIAFLSARSFEPGSGSRI